MRPLPLLLLAVIAAGAAARLAALPGWLPDSGDEWGNAVAPLRALYERGHPGTFLHPALNYYAAAALAAAHAVAGWLGLAAGSLAELVVGDDRWLTWPARAVSVGAAILTMAALYACGRRLWDRRTGLLAAALLAAWPLHAVYSVAARVDSLFVLAFVVAAWRLVVLLERAERAAADTAALCVGLAIAANYNGAILLPWLVAALWLRPGGADWRDTGRALGLAAATFVVANPWLLLDPTGVRQHVGFIASLALIEHPGMEGRDAPFYVRELARAEPVLAAAIAAAGVATAALGTRRERFLLSLPLAYALLFSVLRTKFDRFILPAGALLLLVAAGLPALLARRLAARPRAAGGARLAATALLLAGLATMLPRAVPVPRHTMLPRGDTPVLDWLERHVPPGARLHVQSGVLPLVDVLAQPGRLSEALRGALLRIRPGLDHAYLVAVHVGGRAHYQPGVLAAERIDYAIVSRRTLAPGAIRCAELPEVCAVLAEIQQRGRVAYATPEGVEPVVVYDLRPDR